MGVGRFLDELKDEPEILVGFSIFIAEEFLKEQAPVSGGGDPTDQPDDWVVPENSENEGGPDSSSLRALKQGID